MNLSDLTVSQLGPARLASPLLAHQTGESVSDFTNDARRVLYDIASDAGRGDASPSFERAGPRRQVFFDPARARAAIVTCGGLCPGLNDVIRALVMELYHWYRIGEVLGVYYGYAGLCPDAEFPPQPLSARSVEDIHMHGGTMLGTSRGRRDTAVMADTLERLGIDILFCVGGDGTLRGAHALAGEIARRGLPIAIVGIPKTIDNDIALVYRCFGFKTAVEGADRALDCAHVEAKGARHGVGLVRLMGREAGFIAAHATLSNGDVNYCLIPEVPFKLEGPGGLLAHLRQRLATRQHAVIAVAEGAGRELVGATDQTDASGNVKLKDIGLFLKQKIGEAFAEWGEEVNVRYIDPSYLIRSVPANSDDSLYCADLARMAAHAAMAGKTDLFIGQWHGVFTHVPLAATSGLRHTIDPKAELWRNVLATTGQPEQFV